MFSVARNQKKNKKKRNHEQSHMRSGDEKL